VYQAVTGNPSESLPAGASLDTVLQILNNNLKGGDAQQLLDKVKEAIVEQGLANVFDATLVNATSITGSELPAPFKLQTRCAYTMRVPTQLAQDGTALLSWPAAGSGKLLPAADLLCTGTAAR
jgi:Neuraminidase (sialidase)